MNYTFPIPRLRKRKLDLEKEELAIAAGAAPIVARVLAARPLPAGITYRDFLHPQLKKLSHPSHMQDINKAALRIVKAIRANECIGIETDHDCDGQTSHAVLFEALSKYFKHPKNLIRSYIGHRLKEGYGLSERLMQRILADNPRPSLIITADNGSADEARISCLKKQGIDVIVTDHHQIPTAGIPKSAFACINPIRKDCQFPDNFIAGCMVAWLLMTVTKRCLIEQGCLSTEAESLAPLLDFVAVGTVADCVSLARSYNNRIVVNYGMQQIAKGSRPCWRSLRNILSDPITCEDLSFKIGPLLNSDGRLATAFKSVSFLLAETDSEASAWINILTIQNVERKKIQKEIIESSLKHAWEQVNNGKFAISIYLPDSHSGVHGIVASRLKEGFGRPVVMAAPKLNEEDVITCSIRGIDSMHVQQALQRIATQDNNLMLAFGGHKGAAGATLLYNNWKNFQEHFELAVRQQLQQADIGPVILTDGALPDKISFNLLDDFYKLNPFGREFESPIFEGEARIIELRTIGKDRLHLRLRLHLKQQILSAVWFFARNNSKESLPVKEDDLIKFAAQLNLQIFRGKKRIEMRIVFAELLI